MKNIPQSIEERKLMERYSMLNYEIDSAQESESPLEGSVHNFFMPFWHGLTCAALSVL